MDKRLSTASIVVILLTLTFQDSIVTSQETCNYIKWMMCEKGMPQAAQYSLPKYVRVENFLCDTETDGGGWIIFQRRSKNDTDFVKRKWNDYKYGFGSKCNDHWLGNDYLHIATKWGNYEVRIDMTYEGHYYFAQYSHFKVESEKTNYTLHVKGFSGNVTGDDFGNHTNFPFSTDDYGISDGNCGERHHSGWWYHHCHNGNLNGQLGNNNFSKGVNWPSLTSFYRSLSTVEMKLRIRK